MSVTKLRGRESQRQSDHFSFRCPVLLGAESPSAFAILANRLPTLPNPLAVLRDPPRGGGGGDNRGLESLSLHGPNEIVSLTR